MKHLLSVVALTIILCLGARQETKAQWYKSKTFLVYAQGALSPIPGTLSMLGWFHVCSYIYGPKWDMILISPLPQTPSGKFGKGSVIRVVDEMTGIEVEGSHKLDIINLVEN